MIIPCLFYKWLWNVAERNILLSNERELHPINTVIRLLQFGIGKKETGEKEITNGNYWMLNSELVIIIFSRTIFLKSIL